MICPSCGHSFNFDPRDHKNYSHFIKTMIDQRDVPTRKILIYIIDKVKEYQPTVSQDIANFLGAISTVSSKIVSYQVGQYNQKGLYKKAGLPYLRSMILNSDSQKDRQAEIEKSIYGTKPLEYKEK